MVRSLGWWPGRCNTMSRKGPKNASCLPIPPPMTTVLGEKDMTKFDTPAAQAAMACCQMRDGPWLTGCRAGLDVL